MIFSVDVESRRSSGNPCRFSVLAVLPVANTSWSFVALSNKPDKLVILPRACPSAIAFMFIGGGRLFPGPFELLRCDAEETLDELEEVGVAGTGDVGGKRMPGDGCRVAGNKVGDSLGPGETLGLNIPKLEDFRTVEVAVAEL